MSLFFFINPFSLQPIKPDFPDWFEPDEDEDDFRND